MPVLPFSDTALQFCVALLRRRHEQTLDNLRHYGLGDPSIHDREFEEKIRQLADADSEPMR